MWKVNNSSVFIFESLKLFDLHLFNLNGSLGPVENISFTFYTNRSYSRFIEIVYNVYNVLWEFFNFSILKVLSTIIHNWMPMHCMNLLNHFYYSKKKYREKNVSEKEKKTHIIVKPIASPHSVRQYKMYGMCTRIIWPAAMFFRTLSVKEKTKICSQEESRPDFKLKYNSFQSGNKWPT